MPEPEEPEEPTPDPAGVAPTKSLGDNFYQKSGGGLPVEDALAPAEPLLDEKV